MICWGNKIKYYGKFWENTKKENDGFYINKQNKIRYIYTLMQLLYRVSNKLFSSINIIRIGLLLIILYYAVFLKIYFFVSAFKTMKVAKGYNISS